MHRKLIGALCACALAVGAIGMARAADVIRHKIPNSNFPIAEAVEIPTGKTLVFVSGAVPPLVDPKADPNSAAAYGDTKTQTENVLKQIQSTLGELQLKLADVVKMTVFLAADPAKGGRIDFAGFSAGYSEFFGTADEPNLPARSTVQVQALVKPGAMVEIEVIAARP